MKKQYISAGTQINSRQEHVNAPLFRKCFEMPEHFDNAHIQISSVGLYRLFLNGKELTKGYFAPYINNPDDIVYYDEYEVSSLLREKNVICIILGNGFSNSLDNNLWLNESAPYRTYPKVYLELLADGKRILSTDDSFNVCPSPITFDDIRCGEWYDARLEKKGIYDYSFKLDDTFKKAVLASSPKGEYKLCRATPVTIHGTIKPKSFSKSGNGYIYDFGENNTGLCRLSVNAKEGQRIDMTFGEVLQNGVLDLNSVSFGERSPKGYVQHDVYICRDGYQEYMPSFTFHGFRYVYIEGITDEQATEDLLEYAVIHSVMPVMGSFECDNEMVNTIQSCTLRSDTSNFVCFPMDCPQREKNGWTADASLSAEQMLYNFDCTASHKEWLCNIRKAQTEEGALPGIVPTAGWGYEWGNGPAWDSVLIELPYQNYKIYGDREIVEQNAEAIFKYFAYLRTRLNSDGLLSFGLGDWCEAGTVREEDYSTPLEVTDSLVSVGLVNKAVWMLRDIGYIEMAEYIKTFGDELSINFRKKYIDNALCTCKTQTAQALALDVGIFAEEEKPLAYKHLLELIKSANDHFKVGVIGIQPLLNVLAEGGYGELALKLIIQPSFPSYAYNINLGATTLWEGFHEYIDMPGVVIRKDGGDRLLSFNHHFWGGVSSWFYKYIGGLRINSHKQAVISPLFVEKINRAHCEKTVGEAKISVDWIRNRDEVELLVNNCGFEYELIIPDTYQLIRTSGGADEKKYYLTKR